MSGDELLVLVVSMVLGPIGWAVWLYRLSAIDQLGRPKTHVNVLIGVLALCAVLLAVVLRSWAASDVRDDRAYLVLYYLLGTAWLRAGEYFFAYAGVSVRDDVVERRNAAAVPAVGGALIGVTCCYAGSNIGNGPGWWVVVFSATLSTAALAGVWILVDQVAGAADRIAIDRDFSAGVRLGGLLVASGLILGRAVAGDWHSIGQTVVDLVRVGWPILPLTAAAIGVERTLRPTRTRPQPPLISGGVLPAIIYFALATAYVITTGYPA